MYIQHGKNLVEHHTHYKELHGFDKTMLMNRSEHRILHNKLRKTGKCNISVEDLNCISNKAKERSHREERLIYCKKYNKYKHLASFTFEKNTQIVIKLNYNIHTKHIAISSRFKYNNTDHKYHKNNIKTKSLASFTFQKNTQIQIKLQYNTNTEYIGITSAFSYNR